MHVAWHHPAARERQPRRTGPARGAALPRRGCGPTPLRPACDGQVSRPAHPV